MSRVCGDPVGPRSRGRFRRGDGVLLLFFLGLGYVAPYLEAYFAWLQRTFY